MDKQIVLVSQWCVADDWYGRRVRVILTPTKDTFFGTKTESKKHIPKLRRYCRSISHDLLDKKAKMSFFSNESSKFVAHTYCGSGPSLYYETINVTLEDIEERTKNGVYYNYL